TGTPFQAFGASIVGMRMISGSGFATFTAYNSPASVNASVTRKFSTMYAIPEGQWMIVNPFIDAANGTDVLVNGDCIQYAYDVPPYTAAGVPIVDVAVDNNERFGFRRVVNSGVGLVQMHTGGNINCTNGTGTWTKVSSDNVVDVTQLTFAQTNYRCVNANNGTDCNPAHAGYVAPVTGEVMTWMREIEIRL
ncbi:MAG: hypothetical protein GTO41_18410, partial [Burkholderiales bacterium]|nr:hypothetical protein [Burkholderiales bacterium]